jgi:hypothetical protein
MHALCIETKVQHTDHTDHTDQIQSDALEDNALLHRTAIPGYIRSYMIQKHGIQSRGMQSLHAFVKAVTKLAPADLRIRDFAVLSGMKHSEGWREALTDFALAALSMVFDSTRIYECLEPSANPDPLIDTGVAAHAAQVAWDKFAFGPCPAHLGGAGHEMSSGSAQVRFYDWWSRMQASWLAASCYINTQLLDIFCAHDENSDGVLDSSEFAKMLKTFLSQNDLHAEGFESSALYTMCLSETEVIARQSGLEDLDSDIILPQAFVNVIRDKSLERGLSFAGTQSSGSEGNAHALGWNALKRADSSLVTSAAQLTGMGGLGKGEMYREGEMYGLRSERVGQQAEGEGGQEKMVELVVTALEQRLQQDLQSMHCRYDQLQGVHESQAETMEQILQLLSDHFRALSQGAVTGAETDSERAEKGAGEQGTAGGVAQYGAGASSDLSYMSHDSRAGMIDDSPSSVHRVHVSSRLSAISSRWPPTGETQRQPGLDARSRPPVWPRAWESGEVRGDEVRQNGWSRTASATTQVSFHHKAVEAERGEDRLVRQGVGGIGNTDLYRQARMISSEPRPSQLLDPSPRARAHTPNSTRGREEGFETSRSHAYPSSRTPRGRMQPQLTLTNSRTYKTQ